MVYTSIEFILFISFFLLIFRLAPVNYRHIIVIAGSLAFIAFFNVYSVVILFLSVLINYYFARSLQKNSSRIILLVGILINASAIILSNYLLYSDGRISTGNISYNTSLLPVILGISFYSLQNIAYLVDVYNKKFEAEKNLLDLWLITCYFPKIVAGPLMLYQDLKPQLNFSNSTSSNYISGFNRILLGFFKKMVIADRLAPSVSSVFDFHDDLPGLTVMIAAIFFTIQLYFDFSGYCDIAIGVSRWMGIELKENFNYPLRSGSVTVFWRRWHMSLIRFLTEYVFYPTAYFFRNLKKHASAIAISVTFIVSAIWHGIGLTFLLWACCHMIFLIAEFYFKRSKANDQQPAYKKVIMPVLVLLLVSFSNIFFRSTSFNDSLYFLRLVFNGNFIPADWLTGFLAPLAIGGHQADLFNLLLTVIIFSIVLRFEKVIFQKFNSGKISIAITLLVVLMIFVFGVFNSGQRFIYMQF
jgi:alginate O-acetyltransferase complex protein AlgI